MIVGSDCMALSNELVSKFNEAKVSDFYAINYFVNYFNDNVEIQLQNLNFSENEKSEKINQCREIVIRNLHNSYDANSFFDKTLRDIKNAIYLNQIETTNGSKEIVESQRELIVSKLKMINLGIIDMPVKDHELARLYYIENKSIEELAEMFKCSQTVLYSKLRRIANAVLTIQMSNSV